MWLAGGGSVLAAARSGQAYRPVPRRALPPSPPALSRPRSCRAQALPLVSDQYTKLFGLGRALSPVCPRRNPGAPGRPLSAADQFPEALRAEFAAGYRYLAFTAATRRRDAAQADKHNAKMYASALAAHRQQSRYSTAPAPGGAKLFEFIPISAPRPSNAERFEQYRASLAPAPALHVVVAAHNLALRGRAPFVDYAPQDVVQAWAHLERSLDASYPGPSGARPSCRPPEMERGMPLGAARPVAAWGGRDSLVGLPASYPGAGFSHAALPPGYEERQRWGGSCPRPGSADLAGRWR